MLTIAGISLLVFGSASALVSSLLRFQAEADLLDKRPDLARGIPIWWSMKRHPEIERLYKSEFPEGRKIRQSTWLGVAALVAFLLGFCLLVSSGQPGAE
jgi:hypothetical protein